MKPLFDYQERMIEKIVRTGRQAAFLNMGLGKTRSTLEALRQMKAFPALVVAPVRVAKTVWKEEAAKWGTGLEVVPLVGTGGERKKALAAGADIFTISYENLVWLMEEVDCDARFRAVVWDELSKMKHPGTRRFKLMRHRMMEIPVRIGLTGTPQGNRLEDLWGEMFAVAGAEPLGPSKVQFLMQYFHAIPMGEHAKRWDPNPGAQELIHERIKPWAFSLDASKAPPLPEVKVNVIEVELPRAVRELSDRLAKDLQVQLASGEDLVALSGGAVAQKVRQMAGGAVYLTTGGPWETVHDEKINALEEVVEELQGEPVLVFYWFQHERERILKRFPQAADLDIETWNRRGQEIALAHPASAGHGLNLQTGGHNICWYTLPWSLELWQQANGRLARHGQPSPFVMAHVLLAGAADLAVLHALREKEAGQTALLDTVRL